VTVVVNGARSTLVASSLPPKPTSITAMSTDSSANAMKASVVTTSNHVSPAKRETYGCTRSTKLANSSGAISASFSRMRSRKSCKCGDEYKPTRKPAALRTLAHIALTEPLPFVPVRCKHG
jgi:hypothetical protein